MNVEKGHIRLHQIHIHRLTGRADGRAAGRRAGERWGGGRASGGGAADGRFRAGRGCARSGCQAPLPGQALRASSRLIAGALRPIRLATARTDNPTEAFAEPLADDQRVATTP
jgi:hypothetical protein